MQPETATASTVPEPPRDEIYSLHHLVEHARTLGAEHAAASRAGSAAPLLEEFRRARQSLESASAAIEGAVRAQGNPVPAEEWLLDNVYVVRDQLREITEDLPRGYLVKLPRLRHGPRAGYPRVYALALDFITHTDARLDPENLLEYVLSYQEHAPLTIGELWAIPIMLRIGLVESLGRLAQQEVAARAERDLANSWADRLVARARERAAHGVVVLAELATSGVALTDGFVTQLLKRLRDEDLPLGPAIAWLDERLAEGGSSAEELTRQERHRQAINQVSVGNCITSMRLISGMDWSDFFERASVVERILQQDPASGYAEMDARSRDVYRHEIEQLATRSGVSEPEVARRVVALSATADGETHGPGRERRRHVGYFLIDAGRRRLEADLGFRVPAAERLRRAALSHPIAVYLGLISVLLLLLLSVPLAWSAASAGAAWGPLPLLLVVIVCALPASEVALTLANVAITTGLRPRVLPKLRFEAGVPEDCRTVVVVPALLTGLATVSKLVEDLETRYLGNQDPHIFFALLADFPDADRQDLPQDAALLTRATDGIAELNRRHAAGGADRFHLLHRARRWNPRQNAWLGWERKRGKLEQFNNLLRGATDSDFVHDVGDPTTLRDLRYVITLDADTQLPRDTARTLVGTIAHPLNRPVVDPQRQRVVEGYGVVQPRVSATLTSAGRSFFARVFTGNTGLDPYTAAVSDVYQDLFNEGSYYGKGIYDVDAFRASLAGRVPENHLLSHDLFEGLFARVALASDIEVLDDFPSGYSVYAARQHRWVRGDWQLTPWLLPRVFQDRGHRLSDVPPLGRWKLLDNLRRSLLAPSILALLVAGWTVLPGPTWAWVLLALSAIAVPVFAHLATPLMRADAGAWTSYLRGRWSNFRGDLLQVGITIALLPEQALLVLDAISRTLVRVFVTRRNLLEWETAAEAERRAATSLGSVWHSMLAGPALAAGLMAGVALVRPNDVPWALPFCGVWLASPFIAHWISQPLADRRRRELLADERHLLRRTARKTWRFFEMFVTADDNWLPPDNYQEDPKGVLARRTSPTNIGLYLLSAVAARDLGYISLTELADRVEQTLGTLDRLEVYRGHLYNWYDTATCQALLPAYVSTVDSGNLVASLLALVSACREAAEAPLIGLPLLDALEDALGLLRENIVRPDQADTDRAVDALATALVRARAAPPCCLPAWRVFVDRLVPLVEEAAPGVLRIPEPTVPSRAGRWAAGTDEAPHWAESIARLLRRTARELDLLAPWARLVGEACGHASGGGSRSGQPATDAERIGLSLMTDVPSLAALPARAAAVRDWLDVDAAQTRGWALNGAEIHTALDEAADQARVLTARFESLADRATAIAEGTDFRLLYNAERHLFSIGFNVTAGRLDTSHYDLLASESRLGSLVAIALGQVPQVHWFRLGRQLAPTPHGGRALLSWSGTMFEHLMPLLVTRAYAQTLLDETYHAVVARHIEYGRQRGVPWGISESAYNTMDLALNYQYRAFGVPGLGFKPGLADDLVVSPYSTALALQVDIGAAVRNLRALIREGLDGRFGFYEAIDYTPGRVPPGRRAVVVRAFMAHHQGMTLLALDNVLRDSAMVRRFHADPRMRATELLLQERVPGAVELVQVHTEGMEVSRLASAPDESAMERIGDLDAPLPSTALLSNGTYAVVLTAAGAGRSIYRDLSVTRWREDPTLDVGGMACYVQDLATGAAWSATYQPMRVRPAEYQVVYTPDSARYRRRDSGIETLTEVTVSPQHNAEVRRVTLTNVGAETADLQLTSYLEIALAAHGADLAHPAFGNLFVETEFVPESGALLCSRRPRSAEESRVWLAHVAALDSGVAGPVREYETSRERFVGRGRDLSAPAALERGSRLSNTVGAVLDPVLSLRRMVSLAPGERAVISFCLAVAESREAALELADAFSDPRAATRTFELAWTDARVELRHLNLGTQQVHRFQELSSALLFNDRERRAPPDLVASNHRPRSGLWAYGISGDRPIVVVRVDDPSRTELVAELLLAHEYWRLNMLSVDLILLNEDPGGYLQSLQEILMALVRRSPAQSHLDQPGGVFVIRADLLPEPDRRLLLAAARVVLATSRGGLGRQLARVRRASDEQPEVTADPAPKSALDSPPAPSGPLDLVFANGRGGFTRDGRQYVIDLPPGETTPAPWSNVVANAEFGFLVTENGSGFTWHGNSQANRLTPWSNDPVSDPAGEALYLRDEDTGHVWSPTPLPSPSGHAYRVRHGQGASWFEHTAFGVQSELAVFVPPVDPVKVRRLRLRNQSDRPRRLSATVYVEWVLGATRDRTAAHVVSEWDVGSAALLARNRYEDGADRVAFLAASEPVAGWTADRAEFLGRNGSRSLPAGLRRGRHLTSAAGAGFDPCGAIQVAVELGPGESRELVFLLGQAPDADHVRAVIGAYRSPTAAQAALDAALARWEDLLSAVEVHTPDAALDLLVNRWLPYQVLSCRVWARSAFYQSGGAYGFRDQLQDVLALLFAAPGVAREHILRAAARQFTQGDVQHWWHPDTGQGVRTRCSDDLLWLPHVAAAYVVATGDRDILDEDVGFLDAPELEPDAHEWFGVPTLSTEHAPLYEHCLRALERGMTRGAHDLPLIGDGDWNDGMNRVGHEGRGESVWLAWFLAATLESFASICQDRGDAQRAERFRAEARRLGQAADKHAWDGAWYRRAYFDDGTPLGSAANDECAIDAIAQSWAVIAGVGDPARARLAMRSLEEKLVRTEAGGLILLLTPPFDATERDPGYIKGYVPGVRENGGQYTHAAVWAVLATSLLGNGGRAMELFALLNPVNHTRRLEDVERYCAEPYVVAADVYAAPQHLGRGGWTWYTGSAGWMYRVAVQALLGLRVEGNRLLLEPRVPDTWRGFTIRYRRGMTTYVITVDNPDAAGRGVRRVTLDGIDLPGGDVPLSDDGGEHQMKVVLGQPS